MLSFWTLKKSKTLEPPLDRKEKTINFAPRGLSFYPKAWIIAAYVSTIEAFVFLTRARDWTLHQEVTCWEKKWVTQEKNESRI